MIGAHVLGGMSRMSAPAMQMGRGGTLSRDMGSQDTLQRGGMGGMPSPYARLGTTPSWNGGRWGASTGPSDAGSLPIEVQGGSLRTWSYEDPRAEQVQVDLSTIGRPLNATIEVWNGNSNTPVKAFRATITVFSDRIEHS